MARIRTVKPELFTHEGLFQAASDYQLPLQFAFIALFTQCDQWGRFRWQPKRLKLGTLPYHDVDMAQVLDALAARGFLKKYEVRGECYGCIPSWSRHQKITKPEHCSGIPSPEGIISVKPIKKPKIEKKSLASSNQEQQPVIPSGHCLTRESLGQGEIVFSEEEHEQDRIGSEDLRQSEPSESIKELQMETKKERGTDRAGIGTLIETKEQQEINTEHTSRQIEEEQSNAKDIEPFLDQTQKALGNNLSGTQEVLRGYLGGTEGVLGSNSSGIEKIFEGNSGGTKEVVGSNLGGTKEVLGRDEGGTCLLRNMEYGTGNREYGIRNRKGKGTGRENQTAFLSHLQGGHPVRADLISFIFEHWKTVMNHPNAKLDPKRERCIYQALKFGYSAEQLCEAITGCSLTPHNVGQNEQGQRYDGLHVILRSSDQIDRFMHNYHYPPRVISDAERRTQANVQSLQRWVNQKMAEGQ
jgi:hypothetical protein